MKKQLIYNSLFLLLLLLFIILYYTFYQPVYKEAFVPKQIKEIYRPIARNVRINYEGFYNKSSTSVSNFFRKFGIL
jgi:hypothetical protein